MIIILLTLEKGRMATGYYIGVRLGDGLSGGRLYLDGSSGNTLGGALDLEVSDDVCDLLERHVDVSCEDDTDFLVLGLPNF